MILTCPSCASQYSLDDSKLTAKPRTVRCVACKATWTATTGSAPPAPAPAAAKPAPPAPPPAAAAPPPKPAAPEPVAEPEPQPVEEAPIAAADLGPAFAVRARVVAKTKTREAAAAGLVWGGLAAALVILVALAVLFRVDVVRLWPRTAGAYAKVGLTVNPLGLAPENVEAGAGLVNGRAAVVVTGQVRNIQTQAQPGQPLRIALLDRNGKRLVEQVAEAAPGMIAPDGVKPFSVQFVDPPATARDVEVEFAFDLIKAKAERAHAKPSTTQPIKVKDAHAAPAARAEPAHPVKQAEPLSEHSPDALPEAAAENTPHHGGKDG